MTRILELAPNHLSAKMLLAIATNSAPQTLTAGASLYRLCVTFYPFEKLLVSKEPLNRATLPITMTTTARKRLAALRSLSDKPIRPLVNDVAALIGAMDNYAAAPSQRSYDALVLRSQAVDGQFTAMHSDLTLVDTTVRAGF